ncbi:hypothetical protein GWI33_020912 [Rhynchophorus ferrugineus]|uniref:Uncharacterized protein n=1 Tax=Rhynchophorus ferrugineus TaxID=354439 RepID=A0A834I2M8_RHYFE|nr:hypothetical protein GWI33_020912 [Rhynchophorus ferrugineus]
MVEKGSETSSPTTTATRYECKRPDQDPVGGNGSEQISKMVLIKTCLDPGNGRAGVVRWGRGDRRWTRYPKCVC